MEERIQNLEKEIAALKERNKSVEGDKAWETSILRRAIIAIGIYLVAVVVLYLIDFSNFLMTALVPPAGYIVSTQTLPAIKHWWINTFLK